MNINLVKGKMKQYKTEFRLIYAITALVCCVITLNLLLEQFSESVRLICYILCILSIMKPAKGSDKLNTVFDKPWKKFLQIMLEIYGVLAVTGMYFLHTTIAYPMPCPNILYFIMSFYWVHPIIRCLIAFLINLGDTVTLSDHKGKIRSRLILIAIVMIPCMLFLYAFNPAITSPDSHECYSKALNLWQLDSLLDWHPPFYMFFMHLMLKINKSITFLIILQCLCFAIVFVDGILFLYECGFSKKALSLLYLFITFNVSNILQLDTLWKDIPFMISILWLTLLLMKFNMQHEKYVTRWSWYIQLIFAIIFTGFFRQNGILPALAIIILLPIVMKFQKKIVFSCIICIALIILIKGPLFDSMHVKSVPQLKYFSLANDIMYSYYSHRPMSDEAMEMINKIANDSLITFPYDPYLVVYNSGEPSGYSLLQFMKIYLQNAITNPKPAIIAFAARNATIWSLVKPKGEYAGCVKYIYEFNTDLVYPLRVTNTLTEKFTDLCIWITNNSFLYLIYWRTGIYNLLILFLSIILFCCQKKHKIKCILPYIPIMANIAALFISSGWSDYRYFWPSMTISLFLLFYFLFCRITPYSTPSETEIHTAEKVGETP